MGSKVKTPVPGWRLPVVVGATLITMAMLVLAIRAGTVRDESRPTRSAGIVSMASAGPVSPSTLDVEVVPLASGDVTVTETLRTDSPLASLELQLSSSTLSRRFGTAPRVLDLEVRAGDIDIPVSPPAHPGLWDVRLPVPSSEVTLTYTLVGATTHDAAAAARRVLVQMRPLAYSAGGGDSSVVIEVSDVVVHNIVCPDLTFDQQLCGRADGGRWRTTDIPADKSTVLILVDLPSA